MEEKSVLKIITGKKYYDADDLRFNKQVGFLFSREQLDDFLESKDELVKHGSDFIAEVPLKSFNSKYIFYTKGKYLTELLKEYTLLVSDKIIDRNNEDIMMSRIFSEVEGTLNVENVPTTHKRVKEIFETDDLTDKNDIIIKNMQNAINYIINEKPRFNKENLRKVYLLLSKDCLEKEDELKPEEYYRDDKVFVGGFEGADFTDVDDMMNGLFEFVNTPGNVDKYGLILPLIAHYYILYVHPYFDYNGRTARMVSFWISYVFDIKEAPLFISEAINENMNNYYKAITNTRTANNDLTYFLGYILENAIRFSLVYKNLENINEKLSEKGIFLTSSQQVYLKKILVHNRDGYFNHKMFLQYINQNMSLPGVVKLLNVFVDGGILSKSMNKKGEIIYRVKDDMAVYCLP